ncbi:FAD/NAD P-binding domain-containing protein [Mycena venus]|uniref:FAD/NAD P-binding domain-containing protein n=1 Tax=Mycena venus TaxID=2733690 RepID=A0A8H7CKZ3_9AGAR|nr:FAD/NAD P-binding domain-containing protein [Mycena venus]
MVQVPTSSTILVIGGGPGGSYAATVLAREGFKVTLLERDVFPRYHIGESLLPSCRPFLRFIGAEELVKRHGFAEKPGAAVKLNQFKREGYTDFISLNPDNGAWNVVRSEFDELLLRHAANSGVTVCEGVKVVRINFEDLSTPVSAEWEARDGTHGILTFDYLVDASGRQGIMSTRYLHNRQVNKSLRNVACWGYWKGTSMYAPDNLSNRKNAPWFEALTDETGWCWFIPLHNGTVSVGVVLTEESSVSKKRALPSGGTLAAHYLDQLKLAPGLMGLLGEGELVSEIKSAGDYSYSATNYAGPRFRLVGDAAAFIDPFFSSGVHLAFTGALSAASSIAASIKQQCTESEAIDFHNMKVGTSYTRFLLVVLGIYKQIRAQESAVLSDVDEDNFDRAFVFLRPIIQGAADADPKVTERELQETMDFCKNIFAPTDPRMHSEVGPFAWDCRECRSSKACAAYAVARAFKFAPHSKSRGSEASGIFCVRRPMRILIFGSTGPTGILLVREALTSFEDSALVLYVRTPEKLPEDLRQNPKCVVLQGQLENEDALSKALEGVDLVLSALGPAQFTHPAGTPLAHAYERIIRLMKVYHVNRLLALGTASIEDPSDHFNLAYYSMVKSVSVSMRNAYKDIRAIGAVIQASELEHWTIIRVPILSNNTSREVIAGYIGDGKIKNHISLNRIGFAAFVIDEISKNQWDRKVPLLVSP